MNSLKVARGELLQTLTLVLESTRFVQEFWPRAAESGSGNIDLLNG